MDLTLGAITLDSARVTVRESLEEVGGRDARRIDLSGLVEADTFEAVEERLDQVCAAASDTACVPLSLRPGRRFLVRRRAFSREVARNRRVGAFTLELEAPDPFEESQEETEELWPIAHAGDGAAFSLSGNAPAAPIVTLIADEARRNPSFGDGARYIVYPGEIRPGQVLEFDAVRARTFLDGEDVTCHTSGLFPRLAPDYPVLFYWDDSAGETVGTAVVRFRDRWS